MRPIRVGDRGPAVEDVQRRLRLLGYDLGPTGVDGVFFGRTEEAVRAFQRAYDLAEDSHVGDETWSALVDATFTLGDRILYLRLPHFHGHDVHVLQNALNVLGFACGTEDGIFGSYTERALAEFQRNAGLVSDGIAGDDTVRAIMSLRHVWEGKDGRSHSAAQVAPGRAQEVLSRISFGVEGLDEVGADIARRLVNLATATTPDSRCVLIAADDTPADARFKFCICGEETAALIVGRPVLRIQGQESLVGRMMTALEAARTSGDQIVVEVESGLACDEHGAQRAAVRLLDAVCGAFDR